MLLPAGRIAAPPGVCNSMPMPVTPRNWLASVVSAVPVMAMRTVVTSGSQPVERMGTSTHGLVVPTPVNSVA